MLRTRWLPLLVAPAVALWSCSDSSDVTPTPLTPSVSTISPTGVVAGSGDLVLSITGHNFVGGPQDSTQAVWSAGGNTSVLPTHVVSSTQLNAVVQAALLSTAGIAQVWVATGDPLSDPPPPTSNAVTFTVSAPPPKGPDDGDN
jgi:hypothetical protein